MLSSSELIEKCKKDFNNLKDSKEKYKDLDWISFYNGYLLAYGSVVCSQN